MGDDYDKGGHPPPEMEDRSAFGWRPSAAAPYSKEDAQDFRPILRPAARPQASAAGPFPRRPQTPGPAC
jgi:hypothetical protein